MTPLRTLLFVLIALSVGAPPALGERPHDPDTTLMLRASLYSVTLERDYPDATDGAFHARDGSVLHESSRAFVAAAAIQGSARLKDGRILMIDTIADRQASWKVSPHRYAVGALGCRLLPFRSAAVDKNVIPLGSKLVIPETRGMLLPDGTRHDGVWYAVDTGGGIKASRIDLFVGNGNAPLSIPLKYGIGRLAPIEVHLGATTPGCPTT